MAKNPSNIYSCPGTSNKKCFLDAQTFVILTSLSEQLWLVHVVATPFVQQRGAQQRPKRHLDSTQQNERLDFPPQKPI